MALGDKAEKVSVLREDEEWRDAEHTLWSSQCSLKGQGKSGSKKEAKHDGSDSEDCTRKTYERVQGFVCLFKTPDGKGRKEGRKEYDVLYEKRTEVIFSYLHMGQDNRYPAYCLKRRWKISQGLDSSDQFYPIMFHF